MVRLRLEIVLWSARYSLLRGILPCPAVLVAAVSGIGVQAASAAGEAVHGAGDVGAGLALAARFPIVGIAAVCLCAGHAGLGLFRAVSGKVSARQTGAGVGGGRRGQGEHFGPAFAVVRGLVRGDEFKAVLPLLGGHRAAADLLAR